MDDTTMPGPEAYSLAVHYAKKAAQFADAHNVGGAAQNFAAVAQAFAAIAQAEATARCTADPGYHPGGGWDRHTHPDD
ncbi:hypothetical protein [Streptomyces sp. NRRL F-5630]|uniref:hypothetical protein n=1 Tax=Streptomyces sp. NRRL F-5630 TaxID=1463864 RepID=UPI003D739CC5